MMWDNDRSELVVKGSDDRGHAGELFERALIGHESAVYTVDFDPSGKYLCSGSLDKKIFLWDIRNDCQNYNVLNGHKSAVLQVKWLSESSIVSCSADSSVAVWDANQGVRVRKFKGHTGIVNSCSTAEQSPNIIISGSDDCSVIVWDVRSKDSVCTLFHEYQICSVAISADAASVYSGGIDNVIRQFEIRVGEYEEPTFSLMGHTDTVTGLSLSPDGCNLLSNSMDSTLRCWNIKSFAFLENSSRCEKIFYGVHHGAEKLLLRCAWSSDQRLLTGGSADRLVHVWDSATSGELYNLSGHKASVNQVIFNPSEPTLASCGSDKTILIGPLPVL